MQTRRTHEGTVSGEEMERQMLCARSEHLLAVVSDAVLLADADYRIVDANARACESHGYTRDQILQMSLFDIVEPGGRETFGKHLEEVKTTGTSRFECVHQRRDGETFHVEVRAGAFDIEGRWYVQMVVRDVTEHARREDSLRRDRDLVSRLMETSPVGITAVNAAGEITFANATAERILGLSRDKVTSRAYNAPAWRITDYEGQAVPEEELPFRRVATTGQPVYDVRHAIDRPDGQRIFLSINAAPIFTGTGEFDGMVAAIEDITDRKRAEEALAESERRLHSLFSNMVEGVGLHELVFDDSGRPVNYRLVDVNPQYERILSVRRADVIGKLATEVYGTPDPPYFQEFGQVGLSGEASRLEVYFAPMARHFDISIAPWGQRGFATIFTDITERKRTAEALRASEAKYRIVADNTYGWEFWVGPDDRFVYISPSCRQITGYTAEEFTADPDLVYRIIHPDDRAAYEKHRKEYAMNGVSGEAIQFRIIRSDGTQRWIDHVCQPVFGDDGTFLGTRGSNRDVTEWKHAEEEIRTLNEELERRVEERTAQLEAANKELEAFSYSVSHDLRAPLRSIDGFSHIIEQDYGERLDEEGRDHLARVRSAVQRMAQLIEDLLRLSRVARADIHRGRVDLSAMAEEIASQLRESQPERRAEFVIAPDIVAHADTNLIRIVLENLLGNAWKYTQKHARARIEFGAERREGESVYFVRDDGAGFSMEYADRLFAAFQRLHGVSEFEGTGVGLAIVQRIVQRHGGRVWAEGAVEKGATFRFTLAE